MHNARRSGRMIEGPSHLIQASRPETRLTKIRALHATDRERKMYGSKRENKPPDAIYGKSARKKHSFPLAESNG